jgi:hypothetical protein
MDIRIDNRIPGAGSDTAIRYMPCLKCAELVAEFSRRVDASYLAVKALGSRVEHAAAAEYNRLKAVADEARIEAELAHVALEEHKQQHTTRKSERLRFLAREE